MLIIKTWNKDLHHQFVNPIGGDFQETVRSIFGSWPWELISRGHSNVLHPSEYLDAADELVYNSVVNEEPYIICTVDEVFFSALRARIKGYKATAQLWYYTSITQEPQKIDIDKNGRMSEWPTFSAYGNSLDILL